MSQPDLGNRFLKFQLDGGELEAARCITPYNMMFIQNKIADLAAMAVEYEFDVSNPNQFASILEHEKLKAKVIVLEELITEFQIPTESKPNPESGE